MKGRFRTWMLGSLEHFLRNEHRNATFDCPFSPDGRSIALATSTGTHLLDAASGRQRFGADPPPASACSPTEAHPTALSAVKWIPGTDAVAVAGYKGLYRRDLAPASGSLEELRAEAELLSGTALDPALGIVNLDPASLAQRWQAPQAARKK